jgi:hypothetical protein
MKYSLAAAGLFVLAFPLSAFAQAAVSHSNASPQAGTMVYQGGGFSVHGNAALDVFGRNVTQLILNDLNAHHVSTGHDTADVNFDAVYDNSTTMNRVCALVDSTAQETSYADNGYSSEGSGGHGPGNDEWIVQYSSGWSGYDAKSNDNHIGSLECDSYALPTNTLTANDYSVTPGAAVTLSFDYSSARDVDGDPAANCSATGFTLPNTTSEQVCIGGYQTVCTGPGGHTNPLSVNSSDEGSQQLAAASLAVATGGSCSRQCIGGYRTVTHYPAQSGTVKVYPSSTTTYTYSCTNANGTTVASAKVTVSAPAVNGKCAATHYSCAAGTSSSNANNTTSYTWKCVGSNGGTTASCSEAENVAPTTPTVEAVYDASAARWYAPYGSGNASARKSGGYRTYANATDANGDALDYLFYYYNNQTGVETYFWADGGYVPSGNWGYNTNFQDFAPGTYRVGAYAWDGTVYSPFSGWQTVTLAPAPITASCVVSPTSGAQGDVFTWTASASGGDTDSAYTYSWSGTDGLTGSSASVTKRYDTTGTQTASVKVTDADGTSVTKACSNSANVTPCTTGFSQSSQTIEQGDSATLSWSPSGSCSYTSCTFTDSPTSYPGGSGSRTVGPVMQTSTYGISCKGPYVSSTPVAQTTVNVIVPTVDIKANGQDSGVRVQQGSDVSISWTSDHTTSCTVTKDGSSWQSGLSSAGTSDTVDAVTTYTADCVNKFGTHATDSVTVDVTPKFNEY